MSSASSVTGPSANISVMWPSASNCANNRPPSASASNFRTVGRRFAKPRAKPLQVGQHRVGDVLLGLVDELDPFDVQLVADQRGMFFQPRPMRVVGQNDLDLLQRLTHLELRPHSALRPSETISRASAIRSESCRVDRRRIAGGIIAQMDALGN